jgi:hypothetical protein
MNILAVNMLFSTLVFGIAAKIYLLPRLAHLEPRAVLAPILLLHSMRHLGLMFLTPGAVFPGISPAFTYPAAIGDFIAALLALTSLLALARAGRFWCPSFGCSALKVSWICSRLSSSPRSTAPTSLWDPPTGYRHSGSRYCS